VAAFRVSPIPPLRVVGAAYVELLRNTPLAVLFFLFFFGLPKVGIRYDPFPSSIVVLGAYTGAFMAETVRSGINTVAVGQAEAARALGLTFSQVLATVIMPQALRTVVAPISNIFIALIKNSAVAYTIAVVETTRVADNIANDTARPIPAFLGAAVAYLLLTVPSGLAFGALERRVAFKR
jgi:glutamate transport system permease protein